MPNLVYNNIAIKGEKENILNFLNEGLKNSKLKECKTLEGAYNKLNKHAKNMCSDVNFKNAIGMKEGHPAKVKFNKGLTLDTFRPMPLIFYQYDTTNYADDCPNIAKMQLEQYGCVGWYDWGCKYRGTKWDSDIDGFNLSVNGDIAIITFHCDTAWSCPCGWMRWVKETFKVNVFISAIEECDNFNPFYCEIDGEEHDCYDDCERPNEDDFECEEDYYDTLYEWKEEKHEEMYYNFKNYVSEYEVNC